MRCLLGPGSRGSSVRRATRGERTGRCLHEPPEQELYLKATCLVQAGWYKQVDLKMHGLGQGAAWTPVLSICPSINQQPQQQHRSLLSQIAIRTETLQDLITTTTTKYSFQAVSSSKQGKKNPQPKLSCGKQSF